MPPGTKERGNRQQRRVGTFCGGFMCHQVQKRKVIGNREGWGRSVADLCATRYKRER